MAIVGQFACPGLALSGHGHLAECPRCANSGEILESTVMEYRCPLCGPEADIPTKSVFDPQRTIALIGLM